MARVSKPTLSLAVSAVAALPFASPAFAHHVMGGALPSTAWHGLLSGLGHPIIGLDHLAFVVGVGLVAHLMGWLALLPLLFVAGTVLGCFLHIQGYGLPLAEAAVALTLALAAAMVAMRARIPIGILGTLLVVAGAFHGYAYAESIVGAETAPLTAYIIGFAVIQYCLAVGSGAALRMMVGRDYLSETVAMRTAGGAIALVFAFTAVALVV